ncbi:MAG: excinuclease ABC subunit UvrC [Chloroflexota bacterium]
MVTSNLITEELRELPDCPGVYLMRDAGGKILYVGKAVNLRNRVRSYFGSGENLSPKTQSLVARINDFEYFVTGTEQEALILELNLIKKHQPYYNVRLKDDKAYPYLKIDTGEDWPRIYITRRPVKDGSRYFGPFTDAGSLRATLKAIKRIFPLRSCARAITGTDRRPCLEYHIKSCPGPCIGAVSREEYAGTVNRMTLFLEGKREQVVRELRGRMGKAALALDFEKAAFIRDQLKAVEKVILEQRIAMSVKDEQDVIAFAGDNDDACVQVFLVRSGMLIGRESFVLQGTYAEAPGEIMSSFIKQFYDNTPNIPPTLLLQHPIEDKALIEGWLEEKRGRKVRLRVPRRGDKKQLMDIVAENARRGLERLRIKQMTNAATLAQAMAEIKTALSLPSLPARMEAYDISDIQGTAAVGSMVVFEEGKPRPSHYRRFRIKTVAGADDYAMLQEVIRRRFRHVAPVSGEVGKQDTWATMPDLLLVDGGKGQLSSVLAVMHETGASLVPVASLAKENEEIFLPEKANPVVLPKSSPGLQMLQRLRDEAHRFALTYHQKVHKKGTFASSLDGVNGIGPSRKRALVKQFGSVKAIREASVDELAGVKGMSMKLAQKLKENL